MFKEEILVSSFNETLRRNFELYDFQFRQFTSNYQVLRFDSQILYLVFVKC